MRPKQFQSLYSHRTMLQKTIDRIKINKTVNIITICNEEHRFFVEEQLGEINQKSKIILEPIGRNTAPAIALAAILAEKDSYMLVLSADHFIREDDIFNKTIENSFEHADKDKIVTFGITPTMPHTGYGYIKAGEKINNGYKIDSFKEKPFKEKAEEYLKSENFYWNSGIFLFKSKLYLNELEHHRPDILNACKKSLEKQELSSDLIKPDRKTFSMCPSESFDYAVLENTSNSVVVPMKIDWSDLGSWNAIWEIKEKDSDGNVVSGNTIIKETSNSFITADDRLVCTIGLENTIIISNPDVLLVASKDKVDDVKEIVSNLKKENNSLWKDHREVHRPWGKFDSIDSGDGFQVKRLTVYPKQKLSVQMHHHRSEHWIVVTGIARVHYGENSKDLSVNDSTYHDKEVVHALENPGDENLILIEVQLGDYLGEDDIVRFDDIYGRIEEK